LNGDLHMSFIPSEKIQKSILLIRGHRVLLDSDVAKIYGVPTKRLNEQVRRNLVRFPDDFMFQLTEIEGEILRSQFATSSESWGGRRSLPFAFTEYGAVMLAGVINSPIAINASINVVRAFIQLKQVVSSNHELSIRLDDLEKRYDHQFSSVFDAIRALMQPPDVGHREIGIHTKK
jgi:hypothetical protein